MHVNNKSLSYGQCTPNYSAVGWICHLVHYTANEEVLQELNDLVITHIFLFFFKQKCCMLVEMHEHMLSYCDFVLPAGCGKAVPVEVLELPFPESKFNWANSASPSCEIMWPTYDARYCLHPCQKQFVALLNREHFPLRKIIKYPSQARWRLSVNDLHGRTLSEC